MLVRPSGDQSDLIEVVRGRCQGRLMVMQSQMVADLLGDKSNKRVRCLVGHTPIATRKFARTIFINELLDKREEKNDQRFGGGEKVCGQEMLLRSNSWKDLESVIHLRCGQERFTPPVSYFGFARIRGHKPCHNPPKIFCSHFQTSCQASL
jgi:hypothetical protein